MTDEQNTLPAVQQSVYPALREAPETFMERLRELTGPEGLSEFALERYKVPAGGATMWMVPDVIEGQKALKTVEGIIVFVDQKRVFYRDDFEKSGGGVPPDCHSDDMLHGIGDPGVDCLTCPMNQFGSKLDRHGNPAPGKACREIRRVFFITETSRLPKLIPAGPGNGVRGTPLYNYLLALIDRGLDYSHVVTAFDLKETTAKQSGLKYAQVTPRLVRQLSPEECDAMDALTASFRAGLSTTPVTAEDVEG